MSNLNNAWLTENPMFKNKNQKYHYDFGTGKQIEREDVKKEREALLGSVSGNSGKPEKQKKDDFLEGFNYYSDEPKKQSRTEKFANIRANADKRDWSNAQNKSDDDPFLQGFKEGSDGFSLQNTVDSVKDKASDMFADVKKFGRETLNKGSAWMNEKGIFDDATNAFFKAYNINQKFPFKALPTDLAHHIIANSNYKENQKIDLSGYEQTGDYINDQNTGEVGKVKYGGGTLDDNGCGIIAVNNALVKLGDKKDIRDIAKEFETDGQVLFGGFGTNPYDIGDYFKDKGYNVETFTGDKTIYNLDIPDADVYLLSFWNSDKIMGGIHTVAMEKDGNGSYILYNQGGRASPVESLNDFFAEKNRVPLALHCIKKGQ